MHEKSQFKSYTSEMNSDSSYEKKSGRHQSAFRSFPDALMSLWASCVSPRVQIGTSLYACAEVCLCVCMYVCTEARGIQSSQMV